MSSKLKMAFTLTIIGLLSGASIWAVNELTAPVIADNQARAELAIFFEFFPEGDTVSSVEIEDAVLDTEYTVRDASDTILGYVLRGISEGYGGRMTILVALNPLGAIVDVKVTAHTETPNILTPLLRDYIPNLQGQPISEVEYDALTGATASYRAIQNVVNATRNVFAGDPFIELLKALEIDADGYTDLSPVFNTLTQMEVLKGSEVVAYRVDLALGEEVVTLFHLGRTFIQASSETLDIEALEALNAQRGLNYDALTGEDSLTLLVKEAIAELALYERLKSHQFIYARKISEDGMIYLGTARGFGGQNIFAITLSENGDLVAIENLVLADTLDYYQDVVVPGIARLIAEGVDGQTAPDVFSEATATGTSVLNIVLEAIAIQGGN